MSFHLRFNLSVRTGIGLFLTGAMISTAGAAQQQNPDELAKACQSHSGTWLAKYGECEYASQQWCAAAGGQFNECGSACRHSPNLATPCTMQCVPFCSFSAAQAKPDGDSSASLGQAWGILQDAAANNSTELRVAAMRVLQLIPGDAKAVAIAEQGLKDKEPEVRGAAALSLGAINSRGSIAALTAVATGDKDGTVILAAAKSLIQLGDEKGYSAYYAVLTGQRKSGDSLVEGEEQQLNSLLRNPRQMEAMAFEQGIGFVPLGGIGFQAFEVIHASEENAPILKAASIRILAMDPDPRTGEALVAATKDTPWLVRSAAFDALARRGDSSLLPKLSAGLKDENEEVKFTAAAAVIHLSTMPKKAAE